MMTIFREISLDLNHRKAVKETLASRTSTGRGRHRLRAPSGWTLAHREHSGAGDQDHVHIMFRAHPKSELSKFINAYKSASSRLIKKEYPEVRQKLWKEMFWSQSFCLLSAGGAPIEVIRQYIETQGEGKSEHRIPLSDLSE